MIGEAMHANFDRSVHNNALHFWTVFAANFFEFLLFSSVHWWTLIDIQNGHKQKSCLAFSAICCSGTTLFALLGLVTGWKLPRVRGLLLEVSDKGSQETLTGLIKCTDLPTSYHHTIRST